MLDFMDHLYIYPVTCLNRRCYPTILKRWCYVVLSFSLSDFERIKGGMGSTAHSRSMLLFSINHYLGGENPEVYGRIPATGFQVCTSSPTIAD